MELEVGILGGRITLEKDLMKRKQNEVESLRTVLQLLKS